MDALNSGVWVCIQGLCCRCIFVLHCMHDLPFMWLPQSMIVSDIDFLMYTTCITCLILWWTLEYLSLSILMHIIYIAMKTYRCSMTYLMQNSVKFSPWKCGIFLPYSHRESLVTIALSLPKCTDLKCCRIFTTKIRQSATRFSLWKFGSNSNVLAKHYKRLHTFPNLNLKAHN